MRVWSNFSSYSHYKCIKEDDFPKIWGKKERKEHLLAAIHLTGPNSYLLIGISVYPPKKIRSEIKKKKLTKLIKFLIKLQDKLVRLI